MAVLPGLGAASETDVAVDPVSPFIQSHVPCFSSCPAACAHVDPSSRAQAGSREKARTTWSSSRKRRGSKLRKAWSFPLGVASRSPSDRDPSPSSPSHARWVIPCRVPSRVCHSVFTQPRRSRCCGRHVVPKRRPSLGGEGKHAPGRPCSRPVLPPGDTARVQTADAR